MNEADAGAPREPEPVRGSTTPPSPTDREFDSALDEIQRDLRALLRAARVVLATWLDRARITLRDALLGCLVGTIALVVITVFACASMLTILRGFSDWLAPHLGSPALAAIAAGSCGLLALGFGLLMLRTLSKRRDRLALLAKYPNTAPDTELANATRSPSSTQEAPP